MPLNSKVAVRVSPASLQLKPATSSLRGQFGSFIVDFPVLSEEAGQDAVFADVAQPFVSSFLQVFLCLLPSCALHPCSLPICNAAAVYDVHAGCISCDLGLWRSPEWQDSHTGGGCSHRMRLQHSVQHACGVLVL